MEVGLDLGSCLTPSKTFIFKISNASHYNVDLDEDECRIFFF